MLDKLEKYKQLQTELVELEDDILNTLQKKYNLSEDLLEVATSVLENIEFFKSVDTAEKTLLSLSGESSSVDKATSSKHGRKSKRN